MNVREPKIDAENGGQECFGSANITESCNTQECPGISHQIRKAKFSESIMIAFTSNFGVKYFFYRQLTVNGILGGLEPAQKNAEVEKEPIPEKLELNRQVEEKTALEFQKSLRIVTSKNVLVWMLKNKL